MGNNLTPKPRGTFSLLQTFIKECFNPDRRGFPLYFLPSDLFLFCQENRFWGRIPSAIPPPLPWLNYDLVRWVEETRPKTVLEWGSGASTIWLAGICDRLVSIESDVKWYHAVSDKLGSRAREGIELRLCPDRMEYVNGISAFGKGRPDLVLIDGSWRQDCLQVALSMLWKGAAVVLHDSNAPGNLDALSKLPKEIFRQDRFSPCHGMKNFRGWTLLRRFVD